MKPSLILASLISIFFSFHTTSTTVTCEDDHAQLVMHINDAENSLSFTYTKDGVTLTGNNTTPIQAGDFPSVYSYEHPLADGITYYNVMASTMRTIWVEEHTRHVGLRNGNVIEYIVPAHEQDIIVRWFDGMLKNIGGMYYLYRINGEDFGLPPTPIAPGTPCELQR